MFLKNRFGKRPIALAVAAAITPALASTAFAQTSRGASAMMEEVVVTATKRAENLQDVPVSVQALTGDSLRAQSIMTFDDYVNFLPNVVDAGIGPGNKRFTSAAQLQNNPVPQLHWRRDQHLALHSTSTKYRSHSALEISTFTQQILSGSRRLQARRAHCSARAHKQARSA